VDGPRSAQSWYALGAAGIGLVGEVMFGDWSERWGRDAAAVLLARHPEIDAILCGSDQIARGVLDTARDFGRGVPRELAVIGFDDWEVLTTNSRPELTSINPNLEGLGRAAAQRIIAALDGVDIGRGTQYFPTRLVIRGSTIARR
jgi:LacI family transcriptional regulator